MSLFISRISWQNFWYKSLCLLLRNYRQRNLPFRLTLASLKIDKPFLCGKIIVFDGIFCQKKQFFHVDSCLALKSVIVVKNFENILNFVALRSYKQS